MVYRWGMRFEGEAVIVCHGVVGLRLRRGAAGLLSLLDQPEQGVWYLFSNRRRSLIQCVKVDRHGIWVATRRLHRGLFYWIERAAGASSLKVNDAASMCDGERVKRRPEDTF